MSSPKVLTFVSMPFEQGRANNERLISFYLSQAQAVEERLLARLRTLGAHGIKLPALPITVADLRSQLLPLHADDNGSDALRRIHSHWLQLKHNIGEPIDQAFVAWEEKESAENRAVVESAAKELVQQFREQRANKIVIPSPADAIIEAELTALACAGGEDVPALSDRVRKLMTTTPHAHLALALRSLRLSEEQQSALARSRRVRERLEREQTEERVRDVSAHVDMFVEQLSILDESAETRVRLDLESLRSAAATLSANTVDERLANVQRTIEIERKRTAMEAVVRKTLRRLGYENVEVMQTLTPSIVRSQAASVAYFRDPQDVDRFIEVAFAGDDALSVEIVRADANIDASQRSRDQLAQKRLCDAMVHVERTASEAFAITVVHDEKPGVAAGVRPRLKFARKDVAAAKARGLQA